MSLPIASPRLLAAAAVLLLFAHALPARGQASMYADPKARQAGDVITVLLVERTNAARESQWDNASDASLGASSAVAPGNGTTGVFALDARFDKSAGNRNGSVQRDLLNGTITVRVVGQDEAGNLAIQGERRLSVNGESHVLRVAGVVRPYDVTNENTILSYQIANADIEYHRGGVHRRFLKPAFFARLGAVAALTAALLFAR